MRQGASHDRANRATASGVIVNVTLAMLMATLSNAIIATAMIVLAESVDVLGALSCLRKAV